MGEIIRFPVRTRAVRELHESSCGRAAYVWVSAERPSIRTALDGGAPISAEDAEWLCRRRDAIKSAWAREILFASEVEVINAK